MLLYCQEIGCIMMGHPAGSFSPSTAAGNDKQEPRQGVKMVGTSDAFDATIAVLHVVDLSGRFADSALALDSPVTTAGSACTGLDVTSGILLYSNPAGGGGAQFWVIGGISRVFGTRVGKGDLVDVFLSSGQDVGVLGGRRARRTITTRLRYKTGPEPGPRQHSLGAALCGSLTAPKTEDMEIPSLLISAHWAAWKGVTL
ncbi:hypothetical protein BJV78DRAFT_1355969 [Lactifluus subvellereus]|nr:hypothetical protein BJV78DRAFT_1355969 [Lactifluus subvellereus]